MSQAEKITSLHFWPKSEKPRERLFRYGVQSLSDAELLALFLRSGIQGKNVHALALDLLSHSNGLSGLARKTPQELLQISGLGPAKVSTLVAAFEIGNRLLLEKIENKQVIESGQDLFNLFHHRFKGESEEIFMGVLLNSKNQIDKVITFSRGDSTQIIFSISQIIRQILVEKAVSVIFVHNHPSGDPTPSEEDQKVTKQLMYACQTVEILFLDHIIIGGKSFFSFAQEGLLSFKN